MNHSVSLRPVNLCVSHSVNSGFSFNLSVKRQRRHVYLSGQSLSRCPMCRWCWTKSLHSELLPVLLLSCRSGHMVFFIFMCFYFSQRERHTASSPCSLGCFLSLSPWLLPLLVPFHLSYPLLFPFFVFPPFILFPYLSSLFPLLLPFPLLFSLLVSFFVLFFCFLFCFLIFSFVSSLDSSPHLLFCTLSCLLSFSLSLTPRLASSLPVSSRCLLSPLFSPCLLSSCLLSLTPGLLSLPPLSSPGLLSSVRRGQEVDSLLCNRSETWWK